MQQNVTSIVTISYIQWLLEWLKRIGDHFNIGRVFSPSESEAGEFWIFPPLFRNRPMINGRMMTKWGNSEFTISWLENLVGEQTGFRKVRGKSTTFWPLIGWPGQSRRGLRTSGGGEQKWRGSGVIHSFWYVRQLI